MVEFLPASADGEVWIIVVDGEVVFKGPREKALIRLRDYQNEDIFEIRFLPNGKDGPGWYVLENGVAVAGPFETLELAKQYVTDRRPRPGYK
ncbi:hypothetical protein [Sinorhizobium fredii]|uniref:hypothetical protein n=1 Tax=Rhizobium fredii TaxID=380 RepID=UPI0035122120